MGKKPKWEPAQIGEKQENEVECYTVAIPNLPLFPNKKVTTFLRWIQDMEGFVGLRPEYPRGTLLIFRTENDAKRAKNMIPTYPGYKCGTGKNICKVYVPKEYI